MLPDSSDTIAALASAPGPAARGIIRLSGSNVVSTVREHFEPEPDPANHRTRCVSGTFRIDSIGERLPARILLWPTGRSYTGEPMAEIHTIGSPPLLEAILAQLFAGEVRPARAGEFTLRAFLGGRIDLVQAEAVLGVIDSDDQEQLERALRQLGGGVSGQLAETRARLIAILGDLEAGLDFVEEDIEFISVDTLTTRLDAAIHQLQRLAGSAERRMESVTTPRVVLAGLPNAGKSTLFNALAESELAIVSDTAGTTRDYLTTEAVCGGQRVQLIDTAGQEQPGSAVMAIAQQLGMDQVREADLIVWCSAADLEASQATADTNAVSNLREAGRSVLQVRTRSDLGPTPAGLQRVSTTTGTGVNELKEAIAARLSARGGDGELIGTTGARCQDTLTKAISALSAARDSAAARTGDEIVAIELRAALEHIGEILGTVYTDDILDHIFSNFCIGK